MRLERTISSFTALLLLISFPEKAARSAESLPVRFENLPELVSASNGHIQSAQSLAAAAEKRTGHFTRSLLPTLRAEGGGERFQTGNYPVKAQPYGALEANFNLFRGGRDALEEEIRYSQHQEAQAASRQAYFSELSEARRAFWQLVFQREVLDLFKKAREQNESNLAAALKRIRAGIATNTDKLEFEIARVQFDQDIARLEVESSNTQRQLAALFGKPLDTSLETDRTVPHEHDDSVMNENLNAREHRDFQAFKFSSLAFEAQKRQANLWWAPLVDVYGAYSTYTLRDRDYLASSERDDKAVGIRLTFELFDGLQSKAEGNAASLRAQAAQAKAEQTARELSASFANAKQQLEFIHRLIHEGEQNIEKGRQYLDLTLSEYARGVKNSPDVLSATQKYVEFKRRYVELRRDYQIARSDLLVLLGK